MKSLLPMSSTFSTDSAMVSVMRERATYVCTKCGQKITTLVTLVHAPTCSNHTGGGTKMKQVQHEGK
jgi:Zn finger protein HypA/HybF involved in hydrogenase expression